MAESYEPLVGFNLWVVIEDEEKPKLVFLTKELILPKSKKKYKLTLKNLKVYIQELMDINPAINEVQIDRINSVGTVKKGSENDVSKS